MEKNPGCGHKVEKHHPEGKTYDVRSTQKGHGNGKKYWEKVISPKKEIKGKQRAHRYQRCTLKVAAAKVGALVSADVSYDDVERCRLRAR